MKQITQLQQGDVLLRRVEQVPECAKIIAKDRCTLALGEATGHHHALECAGSVLLEDPVTRKRYLNSPTAATLTHQEHKHIEVPAGLYEVEQVREYDYFAQMARKVVD